MPVANTARFLKAFVARPAATGAVAPSSVFLAKRMVKSVKLDQAKTVVEYGPGTGSFTSRIVKSLGEDAKFFAVELNPEFAQALRKRLPGVVVHADDVCNIRAICDREGVEQVCCIVSGLPWAAFPEKLQDDILNSMMTVLKPGGEFVTFAYLHGLLLPAGRRFREKLGHYFSRVELTRPVWLNLPPALCYKCTR